MDYREIIDLINSGIVDMFDYSGFFKRSKHLRCFDVKKIYSNFPVYSPDFDIDFCTEWMSRMKDNFRQSIHTISIKKIIDSDIFSVLDYRGISDRDYLVELTREISKRQYKNILVSSKIATLIQDSEFFTPDSNIDRGCLSSCYRIGSIFSDKDIYVDPHLKWNDMRVCLFEDVFVNIEDVHADISNETTFSPRILLEFKFDVNNGPSEVLYLQDDECPNLDPTIVTLLRDRKIKGILDED